MDVASAVIMMAGIFYGAMYGGSMTAILVKIPGETSSVVTCIDGYAMARRGRAGAALGIAAFGSFLAGVRRPAALLVVGPLLVGVALEFGPAEYTALVLLALLLVTHLSSGSRDRRVGDGRVRFPARTVGKDPINGTERYTLRRVSLRDGFDMALLAMGLFGVSELLIMAEGGAARCSRWCSRSACASCCRTAPTGARAGCRSCAARILGFLLGLLPGGGATLVVVCAPT